MTWTQTSDRLPPNLQLVLVEDATSSERYYTAYCYNGYWFQPNSYSRPLAKIIRWTEILSDKISLDESKKDLLVEIHNKVNDIYNAECAKYRVTEFDSSLFAGKCFAFESVVEIINEYFKNEALLIGKKEPELVTLDKSTLQDWVKEAVRDTLNESVLDDSKIESDEDEPARDLTQFELSLYELINQVTPLKNAATQNLHYSNQHDHKVVCRAKEAAYNEVLSLLYGQLERSPNAVKTAIKTAIAGFDRIINESYFDSEISNLYKAGWINGVGLALTILLSELEKIHIEVDE